MPRVHRRIIPIIALSLTVAACAGASGASTAAAPPPPPTPLGALPGQPLLILPVRYFAAVDTLGWGAQAGEPAEYLRALDRELTAALARRGLGSGWTQAELIIQRARRNPTMSPDPTSLAADRYRTARIAPGAMIGDPLSSQLRSLTAIGNSRMALLPLELRLENAEGGGARPVLRLLLIDTRASTIRWSGEVRGDVATTLDDSVRTALAERFADLFAAP